MNTTKNLYQWDINQRLIDVAGKYVDFPINNEIYRVEVTDGECMIPDELLQSYGRIKVYECMVDGTLREFVFDVTERPQPPDYVYTPTERLTFDGLVQKVDDAVADMIRRADSGEFDGADGYTPVKGKDYFTESEIRQIQNEVSEGAIGDFKQTVDTDISRLETNKVDKTDLAKTNLSLDALWKMNRGQTWDTIESENEAYSVDVPSGSHYASVDMVGGKSVVWNQLIDLADVNDNETNGITFTVNNGTITANGTSTAMARLYFKNVNYKINHKYLIKGCPIDGDAHSYFIYGDCGQSMIDYGNGDIKIAIKDNVHPPFIDIENGVTMDNVTFIPQLFDLTAIFGAGNEPSTVEEFEAMFPDDYYPYCEPTIISSQNDRVDVASADGTMTKQIETGFPALNSAGSVYDYIDLNEGKLHRRVGAVDLGTLDWVMSDSYSITRFQSSAINDIVQHKDADYCSFILCSKYISLNTPITSVNVDKCIASYGKKIIYVTDSSYTSRTAFKEAMQGVMLYYELAEPIITDIDIPTELTEWLEVESGGSITFHNSDEGKRLLIPNKETFIRKLDEVTV